jgi:hypothetical protein
MQERLLSRRALCFTRNEVVFACRTGYECECGGVKEEVTRGEREIYARETWLHPSSRVTTAASSSNPQDKALQNKMKEDQLFLAWRSIVSDYSGMALTVPSDRLPALSGIAARFHTASNAKAPYIAGHWGDSSLPYSLAWKVDTSRPQSRTGSSFSWASVNVRVQWPFSGNAGIDSTACIATVRPYHVDVPRFNQFGWPKEASISIISMAIEVIVENHWAVVLANDTFNDWHVCESFSTTDSPDRREGIILPDGSWNVAHWDTEDDSQILNGTKLCCIGLLDIKGEYYNSGEYVVRRAPDSFETIYRQMKDYTKVVCLLLKKAEGLDNDEERWRRVGIAQIYKEMFKPPRVPRSEIPSGASAKKTRTRQILKGIFNKSKAADQAGRSADSEDLTIGADGDRMQQVIVI